MPRFRAVVGTGNGDDVGVPVGNGIGSVSVLVFVKVAGV
jgi:hypothetical protein